MICVGVLKCIDGILARENVFDISTCFDLAEAKVAPLKPKQLLVVSLWKDLVA